jgi:hypothetical protein
MISMGILLVGVIGAMRVFPVGLRASHRAELHSRAAMVAQRTIESLKLNGWDQLPEAETSSQDDGFDVTTRVFPASVEPLEDSDRLKAVEVDVQIVQDGRARTLTFVTYVRQDAS